MSSKTIKKNFIYLSLYKVLEMLLPMITSPILSRRLGAEALGIYSYTLSIVNIFVVVAELGFYRYGLREIAKVRDEQNILNQTYSDIFFTHIVNGLFIFFVYYLYISIISSTNRIIMILQGFLIFNNLIDNAFLYIGLENMKTISIRDGISKFLALLLIILLIKTPNDLMMYIVIIVFSSTASKLYALFYARKYVRFVKPNLHSCISHYRPMLLLMIPAIASVVYQSMDKIMVGFLYNNSDVGYYECASKALIPKNIISALGTVMCPRIANMLAKGDRNNAKSMIGKSFSISMIMAIAFMFGISAISNEFAPWFWGKEFSACSNMLIGLSISIPAWTVGEVIRNQYLLPIGKDRAYSFAFVAGVISNAIVNVLLIPRYGAFGAIIATIIAELVMSLTQLIIVKDELPLKRQMIGLWPYIISGILMLFSVRWIVNLKLAEGFMLIVFEIVAGIIFFLLSSLIMENFVKEKIITSFIKDIPNKMRKKIV